MVENAKATIPRETLGIKRKNCTDTHPHRQTTDRHWNLQTELAQSEGTISENLVSMTRSRSKKNILLILAFLKKLQPAFAWRPLLGPAFTRAVV